MGGRGRPVKEKGKWGRPPFLCVSSVQYFRTTRQNGPRREGNGRERKGKKRKRRWREGKGMGGKRRKGKGKE